MDQENKVRGRVSESWNYSVKNKREGSRTSGKARVCIIVAANWVVIMYLLVGL